MWRHIQDLYHRNSAAQVASPGLTLLPKLKYGNVHFTAFSKMHVDLAAQVRPKLSYAELDIYTIVGSE